MMLVYVRKISKLNILVSRLLLKIELKSRDLILGGGHECKTKFCGLGHSTYKMILEGYLAWEINH
jgi:hypothetical protein